MTHNMEWSFCSCPHPQNYVLQAPSIIIQNSYFGSLKCSCLNWHGHNIEVQFWLLLERYCLSLPNYKSQNTMGHFELIPYPRHSCLSSLSIIKEWSFWSLPGNALIWAPLLVSWNGLPQKTFFHLSTNPHSMHERIWNDNKTPEYV